MSTIRVGENESVESALRRFKRKCSRDGIIGDLRKKEFYESPSVKKISYWLIQKKFSRIFTLKICRKMSDNGIKISFSAWR